MRKKIFIGIAAGVATVCGIVAIIVSHNKKKRIDDFDFDDFDDDDYEDDSDDECTEGNRCCDYAEQILQELEERSNNN